jgi:hypothetical protein
MKKILVSIFGFALFLVGAPSGAVSIDVTGGADELVKYGNESPDDASEKAFLAGILGVSADEVEFNKFDNAKWEQVVGGTAGTNLWGFNFGDLQPLAFLIKTGANVTYAGGTYNMFGYLNNAVGGTAPLSWGVIDLALFGRSAGKVEIAMVSHVSSGGSVAVPEPSSLLLLGAGLLGLVVMRRRQRVL